MRLKFEKIGLDVRIYKLRNDTYYTYEKSDLYSLYGEGMTIDNVRYFSSIILRKDHPLYNQVLNTFHKFIVAHSE